MVLDQIKDMPFEVIREQYTQYLKAQNLSPLTVQTSRTDAFYLLRHDDSLDFWALLQSENFETEALAHLQTVLSAKSKGNVASNINVGSGGSYIRTERFRTSRIITHTRPSTESPKARVEGSLFPVFRR